MSRPALAAIFSSLSLALAACGGGPTAAPAATGPVVVQTVTPSPVSASVSPIASPSAAAQPTATPAAAQAQTTADTVYVANTDGQGVFVRKTPSMADRLRAYPDGTPLTIAGEDVEGEGQRWHHVKAPDGVEGYVPTMYTTDTPP